MIREAQASDLAGLLALYLSLHEESTPEMKAAEVVWTKIMADENHHIIVAEEGGKLVSSCVCVTVLNLTRNLRPYALIENVVTAAEYRRRGLATGCLEYAKELAQQKNCYKIMLLTGAKEESILHFYRRADYNSEDKTAFIQWL